MFSCLPACQLSDLTFTDSLWLAAFGITVYALSRLWGKWAFSRQRYAASDWRWHLPRLLYVAFVTVMLTSVPIYTFIGDNLGDWYASTLLLPTIIVAYVAWLLVDANDPRKR